MIREKMKTQKNSKKEVVNLLKRIFKKGQNWSLDLILGIVIFMLILSVFYLLLTQNKETDLNLMKDKSNQIMNGLDSGKSDNHFTIIEGNTINLTKLEKLYLNENYEEIKKQLGVTGDFCIVLEDTNGRIIVVTNETHESYGFGDSDLNLGNTPCGQILEK